jgi:two-component system, chemotaxis family, response regulator Rcp1
MIKTIHVLLVEDNAADLDLTRATLVATNLATNFEIKFSVAKDGVEAIDFLYGAGNWSEPGNPTLILLDLNLPRKDGRQVLAVIKSDDTLRRIPVVVLSSSDSEKDITSCYNLGANCYIVKPVELHAYRAAVRKLEDFWLSAAALPNLEGHSDATHVGYKI